MTKYNGWKNRATWNVHLWLSNEEGLYNAARGIVADHKLRADQANAIEDFCRETWPDGETPDGDRLRECDFRAVAAAFAEK